MARKRKFLVVPRTKNAKLEGFSLDRGKRDFRKRGGMYINDPAEADAIDKTVGMKGSKEVWVQEDPVYEWSLHHDRSTDGHNITTHRNTFGPSALFRAAWEAFERRRKDR